jgi:hypothetical protein
MIIRNILGILVGLLVLFGVYTAGKWQGAKECREVGHAQQVQIDQATQQVEEKYSEQLRLLKQANARNREVVRNGTVIRYDVACPVLSADAARVLDSSPSENQPTESTATGTAEVATGNERVIDPEAVQRNHEAFEQMRAQLNALIEWVKEISK